VVLDIDEEPGPELQRVLDAYLVRIRQDLHRGWLPAVSATHHGGQDRRLSPSSAVRFCTPQLCLRPRAPVANHGVWLMRQILWTMTVSRLDHAAPPISLNPPLAEDRRRTDNQTCCRRQNRQPSRRRILFGEGHRPRPSAPSRTTSDALRPTGGHDVPRSRERDADNGDAAGGQGCGRLSLLRPALNRSDDGDRVNASHQTPHGSRLAREVL
jgi:hypothetical protein